jgi:hypothetical protein
MTKKLKPSKCPYCGREPIVTPYYVSRTSDPEDAQIESYSVICTDGGYETHACEGPPRKTHNGAVRAWDARKVK